MAEHNVSQTRWELWIGGQMVDVTTDPQRHYQLEQRCRLTPGAELYCIHWEERRMLVETSRVSTQPVPLPAN
jgi:hypothetical protein